MITEIVQFELAPGTTRDEALEKYRMTADAWSKNEDLVQKHYIFDASDNVGGGVYIWKTMEAADKWHGEQYKARVKELYGSEAKMIRYDTLLVVDNKNDEVFEPKAG